MNCPLCIDQTLDVTHRAGIEVDICPKCRGIWLDRGELDRLVADDPAPDPYLAGGRPAAAQPQPLDDLHGPHGDPLRHRTQKGKGDKKDMRSKLADRLGDVLEEVLDL